MTGHPCKEDLLKLMRTMSKGDISVLQAALTMPDSEMATVVGSANFMLWSEMEKLSWMTRKEFTPPFPLPANIQKMFNFKIVPEKQEAVIELLSELEQERLQEIEHGKKMVELHNQLYPKIIPQIMEPLRALNGKPSDLLIMMMGIVAETINTQIHPEKRGDFLDRLYEATKDRLRK